MGIFANLFAGQRQHQQQQQQVTTPATAPAPAAAPTPDSQLAELASVWKIDPTKAAATPAQPGYFANVDPKKIAAAVGQMDFAASISPEVLQRVKDGDASALTEALNASNRATMQAMMMAMPGIMAPVLQQAEQRAAAAATDKVKQARLGETQTGNPALDSPAFKPMVDALKFVHATNNPQLSPDQVTKVVAENMEKMMGAYQASIAGAESAGQQAAATSNSGTNYGFLFAKT